MPDIPQNQQNRWEEFMAYIGGAAGLPDGAPYSRMEEWYIWLAGQMGGDGSPIDQIIAEVGSLPQVSAIDSGGKPVAWSAVPIDSAPTAQSTNPASSGGTYEAIQTAVAAVTYPGLSGKPTINGVELSGNKTSAELGIFPELPIHVCTEDEYDQQTGIPTVANPSGNMFYLVPGGETPNLYAEWIWTGTSWERFGQAEIDLTDYVQKEQTVNGKALSGNITLYGTDIDVSDVDGTSVTESLATLQSGKQDAYTTVQISGADATINASPNTYYVCGTLASLTLTVPVSGLVDVVFSSGTTATVVTINGATVPNDFSVQENASYELNFFNGRGVYSEWT